MVVLGYVVATVSVGCNCARGVVTIVSIGGGCSNCSREWSNYSVTRMLVHATARKCGSYTLSTEIEIVTVS